MMTEDNKGLSLGSEHKGRQWLYFNGPDCLSEEEAKAEDRRQSREME